MRIIAAIRSAAGTSTRVSGSLAEQKMLASAPHGGKLGSFPEQQKLSNVPADARKAQIGRAGTKESA
jgi:hypothetical protein